VHYHLAGTAEVRIEARWGASRRLAGTSDRIDQRESTGGFKHPRDLAQRLDIAAKVMESIQAKH